MCGPELVHLGSDQPNSSLCFLQKIQQVKRHHQAELATVENRVRETLFAKENKVASLQKDITQKQAEIATLKNTLLKQRESLHI